MEMSSKSNEEDEDGHKRKVTELLSPKIKSSSKGIVNFVANAANVNTFQSEDPSLNRIVIWVGMLMEVAVLYIMCVTSVDVWVSYPANQFLSTPWSMMSDTLIMLIVIPLTFLSSKKIAMTTYVGATFLIGLIVMNGWVLCGGNHVMDSDADIVQRINNIRSRFSLEDLSVDDTTFYAIKYILVSLVMAVVPIWICCFVVEHYYWMKDEDIVKRKRVARNKLDNDYVRELLVPVPRGMFVPRVKAISKRTVCLTWNLPLKGSKETRSFRVLQRMADVSTPDTYAETVACHDTELWSHVCKDVPGLSSEIQDRKLLKKMNIVRLYVATNLKPGTLYSWAVQPLPKDNSKRRGVMSAFTTWVEISKRKPNSFLERVMGPSKDILSEKNLEMILNASKKNREVKDDESKEEEKDELVDPFEYASSHLTIMDWFKSFMIPALFDAPPNHRIEHPHANTAYKRFTMGGLNYFHRYIPFRVQVVSVFIIFVRFFFTLLSLSLFLSLSLPHLPIPIPYTCRYWSSKSVSSVFSRLRFTIISQIKW